MLRRILIASGAAAMVLVTFIPDDAFARRGGGVRAGGGYRGGAVAVRGYRGGAVAVRGGGYRYGVGAAAVGAAAVGAAAAGRYYYGGGGYYGGGYYYGGGCGYDAYGNWVCPGYYPY
jgi:hypothetical protein